MRGLKKLSDKLAPVLASAEHFLAKDAVKRTDTPLALAACWNLLTGALCSHGTPTETTYLVTRYNWRVGPAPVDVRQTMLLSG